MMKLIFAGLLAIGLFQAPEMEPGIENDPKAKEILDKTSTVFKELETLKADLDITMNIPDQEPYTQEAVVYIKDQSYRLEMKDEVIICDNKSVWRFLKDLNEVQISDYEPADDEITPTNIFNIYENDFYYTYTQIEKVDNQSYHIIDLTPMDKTKSFFKVRVWVSVSDSFIHKMKVFDKNGSRYVYELNDLVKNSIYKDSIFQFNKEDYPEVYIEDLRF